MNRRSLLKALLVAPFAGFFACFHRPVPMMRRTTSAEVPYLRADQQWGIGIQSQPVVKRAQQLQTDTLQWTMDRVWITRDEADLRFNGGA